MPSIAVMLLKHLKQFTFSATRRSAVLEGDVHMLARFYGSPAVCESLKTSKVPKRLSRDDRRAAVEFFVNEYRTANAGKFPTLNVIHKEVGGSYYIVRGIFQEMKLEPKAPVPIVAKALSDVSASVPNDVPSQALDETQSRSSICDAEQFSVGVVDHELQFSASVPNDVSSHTLDETQSHSSAYNGEKLSPVIVDHEFQVYASVPNDVSSETLDVNQSQSSECETEQFSPVDVDNELQEHLTHSGGQEPKANRLEDAAAPANVVSTETRQVLEREASEVKRGEWSSAWSNIMSFATFWRKG